MKIGGLGIRRLKHLNHSLLQKWWWRLGNDPKTLWSTVIKDKHGVADLGWRTNKLMGKHAVSLSRNIYTTVKDFFNFASSRLAKDIKLYYGKINGGLMVLFPPSVLISTIFLLPKIFLFFELIKLMKMVLIGLLALIIEEGCMMQRFLNLLF